MNGQALEVYEIFKKSIAEDEARKIIAYIEDAKDKEITATVEKKIDHLATKEDLAKSNSENIKWMFIFWLWQIGATIGIILLFIKS
ncbi:hypothetical protein DBR11_04480 [Pedobacter sp. HMWF019]|uniref:hypothetical protein n=1 Tax=Pedobacter sp. HMWF019 TaxID=2056856 RepID=UPI000D3CC4E9|nr:hypothetical protein [Pedobacter sp. HMWF019]PTT02549.1 hypothetical protein DBR11_04480 [Pedobacter sp. HMWF019]